MQPHLIKGLHADYISAKWNGHDTSGVRVVGKTVLVLMDECSPTSKGGVSLPEDMIEKMSMAAETGVLVAVSPGAFLLNEDMSPWSGEKPKPGDRCYVEKYAGKQIKGRRMRATPSQPPSRSARFRRSRTRSADRSATRNGD